MTEEELEIAKQLAAHPNFRPSVGMVFCGRAQDGCSYRFCCEGWRHVFKKGRVEIHGSDGLHTLGRVVPDISHPATKGCLLALAREVSGVSDLHCENDFPDEIHPDWAISSSTHLDCVDNGCWPYKHAILSDSEGIALARAVMEANPE